MSVSLHCLSFANPLGTFGAPVFDLLFPFPRLLFEPYETHGCKKRKKKSARVAKRLATIVVAQRSSSALNVVSALCLEGPSRGPPADPKNLGQITGGYGGYGDFGRGAEKKKERCKFPAPTYKFLKMLSNSSVAFPALAWPDSVDPEDSLSPPPAAPLRALDP